MGDILKTSSHTHEELYIRHLKRRTYLLPRKKLKNTIKRPLAELINQIDSLLVGVWGSVRPEQLLL